MNAPALTGSLIAVGVISETLEDLSSHDSLGSKLCTDGFRGLAVDGNPLPDFQVRQAPDFIAMIANFAAMLDENLLHRSFPEQTPFKRARFE